ncbi:TonB-dependent receptor [Hydrocarboniphaga sp.]|uniref:TonB-dependent receptor n=1 Tax=Hydrocarboniphaga sp. TaxID=2033016 RepID=UPI003D0EBF15
MLATSGVNAQDGVVGDAAMAAPESAPGNAPATDTGLDTIAVAAPTAQSAPEARASGGGRFVEEVVVTAQKREEKLQDVPISISAFSGDKLEALGVNDPKDLQLITPGMTYSSLVGYSIIYIRGVGTDVFLPSADTSVATYIDGVYFPFAHSLATSFTKLERIEVLKGPQGTLFGRNSTGGAINIVSKKPSQTFEGSADVTFSNFGSENVKGFLSGPLLGDTLSGSISVLYDDVGPYHFFAPDSPVQRVPDDITRGVNAKLRWDPTDEITAMLSAYVTRFRGVGSVISTNTQTTLLGTVVGAGSDGRPYEISINEPDSLSANNNVGYSNIEYRPEPFDVKLSLSAQSVVTDTLFDYDAGPGNGAYFEPTNQYLRAQTGELQLVSKPGGWLNAQNIEWTSGYYYFHSQGGFDPVYFGVLDLRNTQLLPSLLSGLQAGLTNLGLPAGGELELHGVVATTAHAVYTQETWRPYDWVGLTLGGRYQTEDRGIVKASSGLSRRPNPPVNLLVFDNKSTTTNNFSPKATIDFHPFGENTMLYASAQRGYKSGTYNVVTIYTPPTYIKPEKLDAIEMGIKGDLLDKSFRYSASVFQNKVYNMQTLVVSLTSGGAVQLISAKEATIRGLDFDFQWLPLPELAPGFAITGDGSYLHGRFDDFPNAPGFSPTTGLYFGPGQVVPSPAQNFAGNKTVRTPTYSGTLGVSYSLEVPGGTLESGLNGSYNSGYYYDTQNTAKQPSFFLLNSRVSYLYEPWNLRVTAFVKNLTNKDYFLNKFADDFGTNTTWAPPRQYGITVGWEF